MALVITKTVDTIKRDYHGVTLEIARGNNRAYRDKFSRLKKKLVPQGGNRHRKRSAEEEFERMSAEEQDKLLSEAYAGTVLVGWENFNIDGKAVPFSEENAGDLLFNDDMLRDFVAYEATEFDAYLAEGKESLVKKSPTPTAGD